MKYLIVFAIFSFYILSFLSCGEDANTNIDHEKIKKQLTEILESDQEYRNYLSRIRTDQVFKDSLATAWGVNEEDLNAEIWKKQSEIDSLNLIKVVNILDTHGYPGKTMVGEELNNAAWLVIQHSPLEVIEKYLPLIKQAAENDELPGHLVGLMEDRKLMYQGEEQIYGTQGRYIELKSGEKMTIIWPIKNHENVNKRREDMGFSDTIEEYAKRLGIEYKHYTIQEVQEMTGNSE